MLRTNMHRCNSTSFGAILGHEEAHKYILEHLRSAKMVHNLEISLVLTDAG
jgi:hypothetical protein